MRKSSLMPAGLVGALLAASALLPGCLTVSANPSRDKPAVTVEMPGPPPGSPERAAQAPAAAKPEARAGTSDSDRVQQMLKPSGQAASLDSSCERQCDEQARLCSQYRPGAMADCQQAARQCRESCMR